MKTSGFIVLALLILFSACSGTKKFDYATAYNFKKVKLEKPVNAEMYNSESQKPERPIPQSMVPKVSHSSWSSARFQPSIQVERVAVAPAAYKTAIATENLSKKEIRKQVREEIKRMKAEQPEKFSKAKKPAKATSEITGNLRTGLILGGVGLILLILGGANGALAAVGTILILAGVVFILIDLL